MIFICVVFLALICADSFRYPRSKFAYRAKVKSESLSFYAKKSKSLSEKKGFQKKPIKDDSSIDKDEKNVSKVASMNKQQPIAPNTPAMSEDELFAKYGIKKDQESKSKPASEATGSFGEGK